MIRLWPRLWEGTAFAGLAVGAHLGLWAWVADGGIGASSAGDEGAAPVTLQAASGQVATLVQIWDRPVEAAQHAPDQPAVSEALHDTPAAPPRKEEVATAPERLAALLPPAMPADAAPQGPAATPPSPDGPTAPMPEAPALPQVPNLRGAGVIAPDMNRPKPQRTPMRLSAPTAHVDSTPKAPDSPPAPDATSPVARPAPTTAERPRQRPRDLAQQAPARPAPENNAKPKAARAPQAAQRARGQGGHAHAGQSTGDAPATLGNAARQSLMARWGAGIRNGIERQKRYPRGTSAQGKVVLRLSVGRQGRLISAAVARSSGDRALDTAALEAVRRARLPAAPRNLDAPSYAFTLPIAFRRR